MFNVRHRISFRLYLAIGFAVSLTFAASLVGWFSFDRLGIAQSKVNEESIPEIVAAFAVAQHVGDLVTATDRLSVAVTLDDLDNIRGFIAEISPALQENVTLLSELEGPGVAERLERIRDYSDALILNVSGFDSNILEHYEMTEAGDALRRRLENIRLIWDDLAVDAMAEEVAYWSQVSPESGRGDLQGFLELQEAIDAVIRVLALAAVADDPAEINTLAQGFREATSLAQGRLAELEHLPTHINLTQVFTWLSSLGDGDDSAFDVWSQELTLAQQRRDLLRNNFEIASLLNGEVEALVENAQARAQAATDASALAIGVGRVLLLAISIVSLAGALMVVWLLVSSMLLRLGRISDGMRRMADGDLELPVKMDGKDEVAEMAAALEVFRMNTKEVIRLNLVEQLAQDLSERNDELAAALSNLQKAQDRLIAQEKLSALGELASGLAHEINNPLNFVNNFSIASVDLLAQLREVMEESKDGRMDREQRELAEEIMEDLSTNAERISDNGTRASRVVQALLNLGQVSASRQSISINRILDEHAWIAYWNAKVEDEDFELDLVFDCEEIDEIDVNPQDIGRLFINLVSNACYATNEKRLSLGPDSDDYTPTLRLSTRLADQHVEIRLRDNGTGIPEEAMEKIFNPFFTTKPTDQGTGLGLTICSDIVREHGGSIQIDSEPGEFTEVVVTLPAESTPDPRPGDALE